MKSRTSFFNKTIFLKNTTLYWPLWGLYTIILLFMQPFMIWMEFYTSMSYFGNDTLAEKMNQVIGYLTFQPAVIIIALFSVFYGMALFSYMYNSKTANMIHSLPVNKKELFGTNVISGLVFLIVPQILTFLVSVFVCLSYGMTRVEYLAIWLLLAMATAFVAFAFVTVCAMFTGLLIALPIYVIIVNFLSYWAYYLVFSIVSMFGYGVSSLGGIVEDIVEIFCPLGCFFTNINLMQVYDENRVCTGMEVSGEPFVCAYFVAAVVLYAIAYVTYQKRHIETAGELISVKWLRPVFRWGVGISGGIFGSLLFCQLLNELGIRYTVVSFVFAMLVLGALAYFGADMFVRKSFRVFKKKNWIGCGVFSAALMITFFCLYGVAEMQENYLPKKDAIASGSISMGIEIRFEEEDIDTLLEIHEEILAQKAICERFENTNHYWVVSEYEHVNVTYWLKNGEYVLRTYMLPKEYEQIAAIAKRIEDLEKVPKYYLSNELCKDYDKVETFGTGWVEMAFVKEQADIEDILAGTTSVTYENLPLTPEQVGKLWQAIIADAEAGTLIKYNVYSNWAQEELGDYAKEMANMKLQYRHPDYEYSYPNASVNPYGSYTEEYMSDYEDWSTAYLSFGEDCENIIQTLIDCKLIESADSIFWGEEIIQEEMKPEDGMIPDEEISTEE